MRIALIQIKSTDNRKENLRKSIKMVSRAISRGAEFILLPEVFSCRGQYHSSFSENIPGESTNPFLELARKHKVFVLCGSIYEKIPGAKKSYNTSVLIGPSGKVLAKYRKQHLFAAKLGKKEICESNYFYKGKDFVIIKVKDFKVGLTICYDLRFPDLYRKCSALGADVICVPSAFTYKTGQAHWEVLLRARAIENLCYVLAPNQIGTDNKGIKSYGHSMIIDPWGKILKEASAHKEEIVTANLNKKLLKEARQILPSVLK